MGAIVASDVTYTQVSRTVFGNKRVVIADLTFGNGTTLTLAATGIPLAPSVFGLKGINFLSVDGGTLVYKYNYTTECLLGYTSHATPGATVVLILATGSAPYETIRVTVYGWGGS